MSPKLSGDFLFRAPGSELTNSVWRASDTGGSKLPEKKEVVQPKSFFFTLWDLLLLVIVDN